MYKQDVKFAAIVLHFLSSAMYVDTKIVFSF